MDYTLLLVAVAAAALCFVTVIVYDRIVRALRIQLAEAEQEAEWWMDAALEATQRRHPAKGDQ